ncbi:transcriptional regulator [Thalassobaculum sp.]|uniref:transcriptional regulator n=1 Tax=Thalassobaculum sp. TaxID=2022740 RepID=UPI0032EFD416
MRQRWTVNIVTVFATLGLMAVVPRTPGAAELLVLEQAGCVWCARFDAEIAPAYPNTEEGRRAPLRRVDVTEPWPEDLAAIRPERLTPTFILLADDGTEVARLRGYPGDEFFWPVLSEMMAKLKSSPLM